jgi:sugar transferase (PEP-CTERM/EpsH1 system associated)
MSAMPSTPPRNGRPLVLHVVYRFAVGGLENGVVNLINRMPESAARHGVIALDGIDDGFRARVRRDDVIYVALGKPPGHAFRLYPRLHALFRELKPDIVHTRNLAALEAAVPAWAAGVPVRIHGEHGWDAADPSGTSRKRQLMRRAYRPFVHRYVALSRHLSDYLQAKIGVPEARIEQIYNGVDTARFRPAPQGRAPIEGSPFNAPGLFVLGWAGRMEEVKGLASLARAFVGARALSPEAERRLRLVLVGDGPARREVESILAAADARSLAWLPGERADVPELMRGLDCFVLPSLAEGISNTILEAMASGLPVVATRVGGNPELVEDGASGRLVPAADSEALARAIVRYLGDRLTAAQHGAAGRQLAERRFSLERMVSDYARLYDRMLASVPAAPERRVA